MKKKIIVLGINGGFGGVISRLLCNEEGSTIVGVDLSDHPSTTAKCSKYVRSDLTSTDSDFIALIKDAYIIIICLPESVAYKFFEQYDQHISKTSLLIDTLSVKQKISSIYNDNGFTALSLNPMFGPDLAMEGKNIVAIKFDNLPATEWFISLLEKWKLNIVYTTAMEHDKMTSIIQVATHAAIMAFGITLNSSDVALADLLKVSTPPFLTLTSLAARIISGNKKVYWDIQNENPFASAVRGALLNNITLLNNTIEEGNEDGFTELIGPDTEEKKELFRKLSIYFSAHFAEISIDK